MAFSLRRTAFTRTAIAAVMCLSVLVPATLSSAVGLAAHSGVKTGGTVVVSYGPIGSWTRNFNPYAPSITNGVQGTMYETLIIYDMIKGGKVIPWLATSWTWGKGAKSLTFHLRQGVKWSDGKPFTSADLLEMWKLHQKYADFDPCGTCAQVVSSVKTSGPYTITYNFKQADSSQLYWLGYQYVIPAHVFSTVGDPTKYTDPNPVVTGAFKLGSFSPQVFTLVKNPYYWQKGRPYVSALRFPAYTSNDSDQLALINGEIDWGGVFIPDAQHTYADKSPYNHFWYPGTGTPVNLWLNNKEAPFNNVWVRRAISLAIDRTQISKVAEYGYEPPATEFVPGSLQKKWGLASTASAFPATANIAAAKADLAKATGVDITKPMTISVVSGWSDWVTSVQLIAQQLKSALGMNITVTPLQFSAYLSNLQQGKFDMSISWSGGPFVFNMMHDAFYSKALPSAANSAPTNWDGWTSPQMDNLILAYGKTASTAKQIAISKQMQALVADQVPIMPIMYSANWYEYNNKRFVGWPSAKNPYIEAAPWQVPENAYIAVRIHAK